MLLVHCAMSVGVPHDVCGSRWSCRQWLQGEQHNLLFRPVPPKLIREPCRALPRAAAQWFAMAEIPPKSIQIDLRAKTSRIRGHRVLVAPWVKFLAIQVRAHFRAPPRASRCSRSQQLLSRVSITLDVQSQGRTHLQPFFASLARYTRCGAKIVRCEPLPRKDGGSGWICV